jgi:biopolymer transport protein ExbD/biopolymer transport protein TolR
MSVGGGEGGYVADINVTPMVDVMLVLLIIFMVIAPMLQSGVSVALPKSKYPDPDPNIIKDTSAVVAIPNNGEYYIGRDKIALVDIPQRVKTILKDKPVPDQVVYVKSSKGVKYGEVVAVIDSIREAGFDRIGLVAEKEKQQGAPSGTQ